MKKSIKKIIAMGMMAAAIYAAKKQNYLMIGMTARTG